MSDREQVIAQLKRDLHDLKNQHFMHKIDNQIPSKQNRPQTLQHPYNKHFNDVLVNDNGTSWLDEKDKWLLPSTPAIQEHNI
jgi:hypothetical protein